MSDLNQTASQIQRFLIVSGVALAIDASVYLLLAEQFDYSSSLAKRISFACILVWGFFAHKHYTFRQREPRASEPILFGALYLSGWVLNSFVHDLTVASNQASSPAFIAATAVWACWNFIGQKFVVFRKPSTESSVKVPEDSAI